ncbi:unnamed protein product [Phyllotreta striolata]|uniref:Uncharacterized protein n=1 Tax=Phyllotreta striolata TaxID=444603 RepID=A0A9N9TR25_PHYSR|nr:unnamed protein product [Phyllotreta striolata]
MSIVFNISYKMTMTKILVILVCFASTAICQRPSFAGRPQEGVHPMFKQNQTQTVQTNLDSRFGENGGTTSTLPVDARGDANLVNRLNEWPNENKPFWLVNHKIIEQHRGTPSQGSGTASGVQTSTTLSSSTAQGQNVGTQANVASTASTSQPSGGVQGINNRFGEGSNGPNTNSNNSFSIVVNGQWRTYKYNEPTDSWIRV